MKFGDYLRTCREEKNWTQPEAAAKIEIEQSYLSKLETGKSFPSEDIFERLVDIYKIDLDSFYAKIHNDELEKLKSLKQVRSAILRQNNQQKKDERIWLICGLVMLIVGGASLGHALIPPQATTENLYRSQGELNPDEALDTFSVLKMRPPAEVQGIDNSEQRARQKELLKRIHQLEERTYDDRGDAYVKKTLAGRRYYERVSSRTVMRYSGHKWFLIPACAFLLGALGSFYISRRWK
ncbi:helix-turn-helix domain-containing protein [Glaciecola sp. MH2013]|uniref:helix-turn-helix domain-containing protein n=1 Tax=Glaciecola sp. MH2013 TaxID=2785524 RepID=UPI00189DAC9C|nr:helix-turn-helix domain-containing protein [Glaciecola sp. MH2013]MBF7073547.1 helix-turn-helix domain-containing protein [Glaciecola sp. MH2013]